MVGSCPPAGEPAAIERVAIRGKGKTGRAEGLCTVFRPGFNRCAKRVSLQG